MAPLLERHLAGLDVMAHHFRHAPRKPDRHPRRDHAVDRAGRHQELALGAHEVAAQREAGATLAQDLADERHRRTREEAAAGHDVVAVLHAARGVVQAGQLLARGFRLGLEPAPGGDEVVLDGVQVRISQAAW
jgi:hypothetical protein